MGNLVCPAVYDLGQAKNVVALSVTEGPDKPLKYPPMFHSADAVVVSKADAAVNTPPRQARKPDLRQRIQDAGYRTQNILDRINGIYKRKAGGQTPVFRNQKSEIST